VNRASLHGLPVAELWIRGRTVRISAEDDHRSQSQIDCPVADMLNRVEGWCLGVRNLGFDLGQRTV